MGDDVQETRGARSKLGCANRICDGRMIQRVDLLLGEGRERIHPRELVHMFTELDTLAFYLVFLGGVAVFGPTQGIIISMGKALSETRKRGL